METNERNALWRGYFAAAITGLCSRPNPMHPTDMAAEAAKVADIALVLDTELNPEISDSERAA